VEGMSRLRGGRTPDAGERASRGAEKRRSLIDSRGKERKAARARVRVTDQKEFN
jgi:hypothetical protein